MKAIYVRFTDITQNLVPFNNELKDCYDGKIEKVIGKSKNSIVSESIYMNF